MISALAKGIKGIIRHPLCLVPALATAAVIAVLFFVFMEQQYSDFIISLVFLNQMPDSAMAAWPFQFFSLYSFDLSVLFIGFLIIAGLSIGLNFFFANYAKELPKASVRNACAETASEAKGIIAVLVFFAIIGLFLAILFWVFSLAAAISVLLAMALLALLLICLIYIFVKIAFVVPIMAIEAKNLKEALAESWEFTSKRFWSALLFLVLVAIISSIILGIGSFVSDSIIDDIIAVIAIAVFWAIAIAFAGMAMAFYYLEKAKNY